MPDTRPVWPIQGPEYLLAGRQRGLAGLERVDALQLLPELRWLYLDAQSLQAGAQSGPLLRRLALLDLRRASRNNRAKQHELLQQCPRGREDTKVQLHHPKPV